jgi:organic radical activating enzyme
MSIVVTHECNKNCPFCIDKNRGKQVHISMSNVINALKYAKTKDIKDILLVGGEPTLHKDILLIAQTVKLFGFSLILTTNYTLPDIVEKLDGIVDSFNVSFYNQQILPNKRDFHSDLTLSTLIFEGQLDTKQKLDDFIDKYKDMFILKFSTLMNCNDWTSKRQKVDYLDNLQCEKVILFNEIVGQIYEGCIIKRYDKVINISAKQSLKCHVNGEIKKSW